MDGTVEEIQEAAPLLKDRGLVFLLGKLVVDVLILNGFGIIPVPGAADAVRKHPFKGDGLLRSAGNAVIAARLLNDLLDFLLVTAGEVLRHLNAFVLCRLFSRRN